MKRGVLFASIAIQISALPICAQQSCTGRQISGVVEDSTHARIPNASIALDNRLQVQSDSEGRFTFECVSSDPHHRLNATATGFSQAEITLSGFSAKGLVLTLIPAVSVELSVDSDNAAIGNVPGGLSGQVLSGDQLQTLADDPDDLQRELQQFAASAGSSLTKTIISVDGFQDDSTLPPKSSIQRVAINPDLFSAEYREPPFEGGRVEVFTKPGAKTFHGALFATNSSSWMNARDPFALSSAAIGKQRYGGEINGPVTRRGSNFSITLEHRSINDFAVVNAVTLNTLTMTPSSLIDNIAIPQRLWVGTSRLDAQFGPKNVAFVSYSANVDSLVNVGVGGTTLPEAGYDSGHYQHTIRTGDTVAISAKALDQARLSFDWRGENDSPNSTSPQVQVAGSFTGGGASIGPQQIKEFRIECDNDFTLTRGTHLLKTGVQFLTYKERRVLPSNVNGTYIFGGGVGPTLDVNNQPTGQSSVLTSLEQYRRTLLGLPGGAPSQFSNVSGDPTIAFNQTRVALYMQDNWQLTPKVTVSAGMRYFLQNDPLVLNGATPRVGVSWAPNKDKTLTLHAHVGLFAGQYSASQYAELEREDGTARITSLVYSPQYLNPFVSGSAVIHSVRTLASGFHNVTYSIAEVGGAKEFMHGWTVNLSVVGVRISNDARTLNVNTPLNGSPTGLRPYGGNIDILQSQNSGHSSGDVEIVGLSQHSLKWLQVSFGTVRSNVRTDGDDDLFASPQSAYSDAGEFARRTGDGLWQTYGNAVLKLPSKIQLTSNYFGTGNQPFNLTTGFDNNGDGTFNDRPQFQAGTGDEGLQTPYGILTSTGGVGTVRRNAGNLPWTFHLDVNLQRAFAISGKKAAEHKQTLTLNVRSSNVLNHTNVTAEGGVLGSPFFDVPYAADNGRRVEGGLRYSF